MTVYNSTAQHSLNYYLKSFIRTLIGKNNTNRIRKIKLSLKAAINEYNKPEAASHQTEREQNILSLLMTAHRLEKALVMGNKRYIESANYIAVIEKISQSAGSKDINEEFAVNEVLAVMRAALASLEGHEDEKASLAKYNIPESFRGGCERISKSEILKHLPAPEEFRNFL